MANQNVPVEQVSYLDQIERIRIKVDEFAERINWTLCSETENDQHQVSEDTMLRTALVELEYKIDKLMRRVKN